VSRKIFMVVFVSILFLTAVTLVSCHNGLQPDLIPVRDGADVNFCDVDDQNRLIVHVKNQGAAEAPPSTTRVEFKWGGTESQTVDLPTPLIAAGATQDIPTETEFPMGCFDPDCGFTITVDVNNDVAESGEANNTADGLCLG